MKKQILLGIFACLMHSLIAASPNEQSPLIQNRDPEQQKIVKEKPIYKCLGGACVLLALGVVAGGIYGLTKINLGTGSVLHRFPPCNQIYRNHTKDLCSSTLPSPAWLDQCRQLAGMQKISKQSCTPGCHWNINNGPGVFVTGEEEEETLPQEELTRFHEWGADDYAYAICENREGSWFHTIKEMFTNRSIPYWTTKTEPGVKWDNGPHGISTFPTQGLVYPEEYSDLVYDLENYNEVLNSGIEWNPCHMIYNLHCIGKMRPADND